MEIEKELKIYAEHGLEDPRNFPQAKSVLTVSRTGSVARQIWSVVEESINSFKITPPIAEIENAEAKNLQELLFRVGLSLDGSIKNEMGHGSMGQGVGVLTPAMFNADPQPQSN